MKTMRVTVTDARMILSPGCSVGRQLIVKNYSPTQGSVYLGDMNVTGDTGFELKKNEQITFNLAPEEDIWAIAENEGSILLSVFMTGESM